VKPKDIQLIGSELAIVWDDGSESYFPSEFLRKHSPSAQNIGEKDIFGNQYGGDGPKEFSGVTIKGWEFKVTMPSALFLATATVAAYLVGNS